MTPNELIHALLDKQHALDALKSESAELAKRVEAAQQEVDQLRQQLVERCDAKQQAVWYPVYPQSVPSPTVGNYPYNTWISIEVKDNTMCNPAGGAYFSTNLTAANEWLPTYGTASTWTSFTILPSSDSDNDLSAPVTP